MSSDVALISLGSNIAPERNLPAAVAALGELGRITAVSSVWESDPIGFTDQPRFRNAAVRLETSLPWRELRDHLRRIEDRLGRVRDPSNKNAPRTIDLDLSLYADLVVAEGTVTIPDPEIPVRPFLAIPLAEVDRDRLHPTLGVSMAELARKWNDSSGLTRDSELSRQLSNRPEIPA